MTLFLSLAPYGAFAALMLTGWVKASLFLAATVCLLAMMLDLMRGRSIKMLGLGSAVIFAALGGYLALAPEALSDIAVKLAVQTGLLAIVLLSIAIRRPFTVQIAREMTDAETARLPGFLAANYVIAWAWVLALLLMMLANVLDLYVPGTPLWAGLAIIFVVRNIAIWFSRWYPQRQRAKHAGRPVAA